jgi:hypothetical protein
MELSSRMTVEDPNAMTAIWERLPKQNSSLPVSTEVHQSTVCLRLRNQCPNSGSEFEWL